MYNTQSDVLLIPPIKPGQQQTNPSGSTGQQTTYQHRKHNAGYDKLH